MEDIQDYESFICYAKKILQIVLGKSEEEIYFKKIKKTDEYEEDELLICGEDEQGISAVRGIYTRELYEKYQSGEEIESIVGEIVTSLEQSSWIFDKQIFRNLEAYEKTREHLVVRAISYEKNKKVLEDYVYQVIGDIALVLYEILESNGEQLLSFRVGRVLFEKWGMPEAEVLEQALINTGRWFPPRIYSFAELLKDVETDAVGDFMNVEESISLNHTHMGNCLTNTIKINGATSIFLPGVARRLAELLSDDFYIAFTSIHEVMIHGAGSTNTGMIQKAVEGMERFLSADGTEYLSSHIYYYNRKEECLSMLT